MSAPDLSLPKGLALRPEDRALAAGEAIVIEEGIVDLFAVDDRGVRFPVAVLEKGDIAVGAASPVMLIAIPRQDAELGDAPSGQVDAAALSTFASRLAADLGDAAVPLTTTDAAGFPEALASAVTSARTAANAARAARARASLAASERQFEASLGRIETSAETLRAPDAPQADHPLAIVLSIIGDQEGFTVTAPSPDALSSTTDPLRVIAHTSGVRYRPVNLVEGWEAGSQSCFLCAIVEDGVPPQPVALIRTARGYRIQGARDPFPRPLTKDLAAKLVPRAYEFYAPIAPNRPVTVMDVLKMALRGMNGLWLLATTMALLIALLGLMTPVLTNVVIGTLIPQGFEGLLVQAGLALVVAASLSFVFSLVQNFTVSVISQRATRTVQAAFWDRVLSLPAGFFRDFSSGDLTVRVLAVDTLQALISSQVVSAALAAVFGLVNLFLMFNYDFVLGVVGLAFLILTVLMLYLSVRAIARYATQSLTETRRANGWLVQMLSGIMKIRIANAEKRLEAQYLDIARRQNIALANQTLVVGRMSAWFIFAASGATAFFYFAIRSQWTGASAPITTADYMAFASAYGMAFAAIAGLSSLISPIANAGPTFSLLSPIMEGIPETAGDRQDPGKLTGRIELRDVHFRYTEDGPEVLKGLNLTVEPGQMVALVGPSGAGKSTITRLLLGFDAPESGQVLFDGRDLSDLDPTLVRSQMGVVVQEGRITNGSIMKNILGGISQDESLAWAAAEKAALADDIRAMPMQMQTIVDPANISGGQAQRILLARALVRSPSILILDEATSALDNASQAIVTKAMADLEATRVVIAHRLSTVRTADQIVVLVNGRAVESGTFDELMAKDGEFAALVKRQVA